jgi:superfamily II RNA helicase
MDLLLTESLEQGVFWSLTPAEMAAVASFFVYEPRGDQETAP